MLYNDWTMPKPNAAATDRLIDSLLSVAPAARAPARARALGRGQVVARPQRCEIAQHPTSVFTRVAEPCGRWATYQTDDLVDGGTTFMCSDCADEIARDNDGVRVERVES